MPVTRNQRKAIVSRNAGNLLVSASAGAGKTKVLVDRVIYKLMHVPHVGIDNLLIVTFTRAAAKEMKDRIETQLRQQLRWYPNQNYLLDQLRKLPVANISTLDAFCQRVVEHYYYVIGLDPHFRILTDSTEVSLLRDLVWQNVREDFYGHDQNGDFVRLTQNFANRKADSDDQLTDLVYRLYDYANVNPNPRQWLDQLVDLYQVGKSLTRSSFYRRHLLPQLKIRFQQVGLNFQNALRRAHQNGMKKEAVFMGDELHAFNELTKKLSTESWNDLKTDLNQFTANFKADHGTFPRKSNKADSKARQLHDEIKADRDEGKKRYRKVVNQYFSLNEAQNLRIIHQACRIVSELVKVVKTFSKAYREAKHQRHALEFIDVEHYALAILQTKTKEGRAVKRSLRRQFNEIMVDEYQDNNRLQDQILQTVARTDQKDHPQNVFMVGDVKQSIYRFRLADPNLFVQKRNRYRDEQNHDLEINLADNFRSTRNVDRFVNLIFDQVMHRDFGNVDYANEKFGANYYTDANHRSTSLTAPVRVMIYESHDDTDEPYHADQANDRFQIDDSSEGQIELVAQEIERLVGNPKATIYDRKLQKPRPIKYRDIALIASTRNNNLVISDVFRNHGIPVAIDGSQSYFKTTEIQIMMSLLEIIDNPYQDIPLVAVLRSPIVGLDENQLAYLRINSKTGDYYQAVRKFEALYPSTEYPATKFGDHLHVIITRFLRRLSQFRDIAEQRGLVDLIWNIYQTTGFLDYVGGMPAGAQRQANLHALYERAADYEKTSFRGLFQFVRFVRRMQDQQEDLAEAAPEHDTDTVKAMTIHGSKGLEYPVVFLIDASRNFNQQDLLKGYVLNDKLGLGIKYFDRKRHLLTNTLQDRVITGIERSQGLAEEMRKLYVALTRAEQRLYVVGATKDSWDRQKMLNHWVDLAHSPQTLLSVATRSKARNYLDWIGPALVRHPIFEQKYPQASDYQGFKSNRTKFTLNFYNNRDLAKHHHEVVSRETNPDPQSVKLDAKTRVFIKRVMTFKYPHQAATQEGNYRSVSDVKQLFEDPNQVQMGRLGTESDDHGLSNQFVTGDFTVPQFIQGARQPKSTEIGTATHLVLQMIDLHHRPTEDRVDRLIKRLVADQMIKPNVAERINRGNVLSFFNSTYGQAVLSHPDAYHRETPFSLLIDAHRIMPKKFDSRASERILIHGIIDGYLYYDHRAMIVDYKTDYVDRRHQRRSIAKIKDRYRGQLNLYGMALSSVIGHPVEKKYLYLLSIHQLVPIN